MTIPTGGGKTFTSMGFALNHAMNHGLKRIIYVIPYTSIIEQNAAEFKMCLGRENVLEHHSNFDWEQDRNPNDIAIYDGETMTVLEKLKLAAENWDIPIVVTTNVQFFESLFSNRPSRCRKLHNLAKSVIIFDEAQMLPREFLKPCLYAVHELVTNFGASAVFCTATQPSLEQFLPDGSEVQELTDDPSALYEVYKRVRVKNIGTISDVDIAQLLNQHEQALCIVNTRKHARGLFQEVSDFERFHLSTLMCPSHRRQTISVIRDHLSRGEICRVVSTQVMEAGIDIDFPVGYRALSGLDSIIQAAGRVNREGRATNAVLYVFEPDSPYVKRTPAYIQQGVDVARKILREYEIDPVSLDAIDAYFAEMYGMQSENAYDAIGILNYFEKRTGELNFDFRTAAERFKLIEDDTVPVIIPFDERAVSLLKEIRSSRFPSNYSRQLQVYTVNIYEREFQSMQSLGLIDAYSDTYAVLNDMTYYDAETGLLIPETGGEALFFDG
jgi:CRISPR-associated endonuclease/helicase Cas3